MKTAYQQIIGHWAKDQSFNDTIITLFEKVRDIPYGDIGSRDPLEVYKQQKGTCSGKHELLKGLYTTLGLQVKDFIIIHEFNNLPVSFPENIQNILNETTITDPHNFIKIKRNNEWFTIDVTWDIGLKKVAFPVNEDWNGFQNLDISVAKGGEIFETANPMELKRDLITKLPEITQVNRKVFLKKLTNWLEVSR